MRDLKKEKKAGHNPNTTDLFRDSESNKSFGKMVKCRKVTNEIITTCDTALSPEKKLRKYVEG